MKRLFRWCFVLLIFHNSPAICQFGNIFIKQNFTLEEVSSEASANRKMLLLYFYDDHCYQCKLFEKLITTDSSLGAYYDNNFVIYPIKKNSVYYSKFKTQYGFSKIPEFLFLNEVLKPIHLQSTISDKASVEEMARTANDSTNGYFAIQNRYFLNSLDSSVLLEFALKRLESGIYDLDLYDYDSIAVKYFYSQSDAELLTFKNWNYLKRLVKSVDDPFFDYVLNHENQFANNFGSSQVNEMLRNVVFNSICSAPKKFHIHKDLSSYQKAKTFLPRWGNPNIYETIADIEKLIQE